MDPQEEVDFEQEFNAAAAAMADPAPAPAPAPGAAGDDNAEPPAPAPASAASAPAPAPAPAADESGAPAPAPAASDAPAPAPKPPTMEELQQELQAFRERERASAARASFNAREVNRLTALVQQLQQRLTPSPAPAQTPSPSPAPAPVKDVLTDAPDLEAAVRRRAEQIVAPIVEKATQALDTATQARQAAEAVQQTVEPIADQRVREQIANTHTELDRIYGKGWKAKINEPEFDNWMAGQPKWVQDLYESALTVEDTSTVLGRYFAKHGFPAKDEPAPPAPSPAPGAAPTPAPPSAAQKRLMQAAGIPARSAPRTPAAPAEDDFEGNFALAAAALAKQP